MKIEMVFPTEKVKQSLNTDSDLLPSDVRQIMSVLTLDVSDVSNKYKNIMVVFLRDKLRETYDAAVSKGSDEVTIIYEAPSDEDWEEHGFVRQGDFMVKPC